jgi:3-phenylpropionate/cinnamic acid dioxygenase small subunit
MRPAADEATRRAAEAFVHAEARLLDEGRFVEWLELFAEDAVYWVPGQPGQASPHEALSLFFERKPLLALRVARLADPQMHAHVPAT